MFAIVAISGKQYKVRPNETIEVDQLEGKTGQALTFDKVLLTSDGKKTNVGTPTIKGMVVKAKIAGHVKGEKIAVRRFKSKVRYRKSRGFRHSLTRLTILTIGKS